MGSDCVLTRMSLGWVAYVLLCAAVVCMVGCRDDVLESPVDNLVEAPRDDLVDTPSYEKMFGGGRGLPCSAHNIPEESHFLLWTPNSSQLVFGYEEAIFTVDAEGTQLRKVVDMNPGRSSSIHGFTADVSPDGSKIAYSTCEYSINVLPSGSVEVYEIAVANIDGTGRRRLSNSSDFDGYPKWSPDGTRIAYIGYYLPFFDWASRSSIFTMAEDGSQVRELPNPATFEGRVGQWLPPVWSRDGRFLATIALGGLDRYSQTTLLYTVEVDNSEVKAIAEMEALFGMAWSPDGQFLAYSGFEGDEPGTYVMRRDGTELRQIVEVAGPYLTWSPDGSEILFIGGGMVKVVGVDNGELRKLDLSDPDVQPLRAAWSSDGSRIAVLGASADRSVLFTMDRDGTDQRILVREGVDGRLRASNRPKPQTHADVAVCSAGFVVQEPEANPGLVRDCETLLGVRNTLAGGAEIEWSEHIPIGEWEGVNLGGSPPRVHYLDLSNRGLTGTIPPELGRLTELRSLSLADWGDDPPNALTGPIPRELGELRELETLFLSSNDLSGSIPTELGRLKNLQKLLLDSNQLTGPVPPELGGLTKLSSLDLSGNRLSGSIPRELAGLKELDTLPLRLMLEGNNLSGCIPVELPEIWVRQSGLERCEPKEAKSP